MARQRLTSAVRILEHCQHQAQAQIGSGEHTAAGSGNDVQKELALASSLLAPEDNAAAGGGDGGTIAEQWQQARMQAALAFGEDESSDVLGCEAVAAYEVAKRLSRLQ